MKSFAIQTADAVESEKVTEESLEISEISKQLALVNLEKSELSKKEDQDKEMALNVLANIYGAKLNRLERLIKDYQSKQTDEEEEIVRTVSEKYSKRKAELVLRENSLNEKIDSLRVKREADKALRRLTVLQGFSSLSNRINDAAIQATEELWLNGSDVEEVRKCLEVLPDPAAFREAVTPQVTGKAIAHLLTEKPLSEKDVTCPKCGSILKKLRELASYGTCSCSSCGHHFNLSSIRSSSSIGIPDFRNILDQLNGKSKEINFDSQSICQSDSECISGSDGNLSENNGEVEVFETGVA